MATVCIQCVGVIVTGALVIVGTRVGCHQGSIGEGIMPKRGHIVAKVGVLLVCGYIVKYIWCT